MRKSLQRIAFGILFANVAITTGDAQLTIDPEILRDTRIGDRLRPELLNTERIWDFEDGTLQGFVVENMPDASSRTSLINQPTFGETVTPRRATNTDAMAVGENPCAGLALDELTTCDYGPGLAHQYFLSLRGYLDGLRNDLAAIGGDYWNGSFPIGKQGNFWIGTFENSPSRRARAAFSSSSLPRPEGGDAARGRLISPEVELRANYFSLLVGGGCSNDVGVYLEAQATELRPAPRDITREPGPADARPDFRPTRVWRTLNDAAGTPIAARGKCVENMTRVVFDIRHLAGVKARIVIDDRSTAPFGHINVDDIRLTNRRPPLNSRETDPVWGVADLHAHLMNEKAFAAYDRFGLTPEARALWGSALGPINALGACNDTHTTIGDSYMSFVDPVVGAHYTLCRDMCLNLLEGAGLPEHPEDGLHQDGVLGGYHSSNGGHPGFRHWPLWYSAIHQQMHWTWVRRAYQGGLRLMVASVGNSEVISFALAKERDHPFTSDQDAVATQIPAIKEFARLNSDWMEVAYTPRQARRIMNAGKLAVIIGLELDHVMDNCGANVTAGGHHRASSAGHPFFWAEANRMPQSDATGIAGAAVPLLGAGTEIMHYTGHPTTCSDPAIDARVDALYREGVRQIIPMHFSDNMLGGYAITGDLFVASAIFGNPRAQPPTFMAQADLEARYGANARPFEPASFEPTYGWNEARRREWAERRPIQNKLAEVSLPIWARLGPDTLVNTDLLPPDISRNIGEFFLGRCISDDGWRIVAAIFSGGATEASCAVTTITEEALNAARSTLPYEGALDSPAMIPLELSGEREELSFHVNARGLTREGEVFVGAMAKRGMTLDIQHGSDLAKDRILDSIGAYPVIASHGGVAGSAIRTNENALSQTQMRRVYDASPFVAGLVGLGVQSTSGTLDQLEFAGDAPRAGGDEREARGVAIGTDINGIDWHAPPRFGQYGVYNSLPPDTPFRRSRGVKVNYATYPSGTNPHATTGGRIAEHPALNPSQIIDGGAVLRTFDINYDGLAHYGLLPDFFQEMRALEATPATLSPFFKSAEAMIRVWEENCFRAYEAAPAARPRTLASGCGPASDYGATP